MLSVSMDHVRARLFDFNLRWLDCEYGRRQEHDHDGHGHYTLLWPLKVLAIALFA